MEERGPAMTNDLRGRSIDFLAENDNAYDPITAEGESELVSMASALSAFDSVESETSTVGFGNMCMQLIQDMTTKLMAIVDRNTTGEGFDGIGQEGHSTSRSDVINEPAPSPGSVPAPIESNPPITGGDKHKYQDANLDKSRLPEASSNSPSSENKQKTAQIDRDSAEQGNKIRAAALEVKIEGITENSINGIPESDIPQLSETELDSSSGRAIGKNLNVASIKSDEAVSIVDLLTTTSHLLGSIHDKGLNERNSKTDKQNETVYSLDLATEQLVKILKSHIRRNEGNKDEEIAIHALRLGVESLEVSLSLMHDKITRRNAINAYVEEKKTEKLAEEFKAAEVAKNPVPTVPVKTSEEPLKFDEDRKVFRTDNKSLQPGTKITRPEGQILAVGSVGKLYDSNSKPVTTGPNGVSFDGNGKPSVADSLNVLGPNAGSVLFDNDGKVLSSYREPFVPGIEVGLDGKLDNSDIKPVAQEPTGRAFISNLDERSSEQHVSHFLEPSESMTFNEFEGTAETFEGFLSNRFSTINKYFTGEISFSEARGSILIVTIAFTVGIAIGYAISCAIASSDSNSINMSKVSTHSSASGAANGVVNLGSLPGMERVPRTLDSVHVPREGSCQAGSAVVTKLAGEIAKKYLP